jgi:muramoyltetrapeptide carboxypeptidase
MLQHLKLAGILRKAKGIVVGDFSSCVTKKGSTSLDIRQIFIETLCRFKYPVISGFPYGHMKNSLSFPIGIRVRINGAKNSLEFLEAGVI